MDLARFNAQGRAVSVIAVSIDQLATIRREHGPVASDQVLREIARRMRALVRPEELLALRDPTDAFAIVVPDSVEEVARDDAQYLRAAIAAEPVACDDMRLTITASLGVADAEPGRVDVASLLYAAHVAMKEATAEGGNRVTVLDATVLGRAAP